NADDGDNNQQFDQCERAVFSEHEHHSLNRPDSPPAFLTEFYSIHWKADRSIVGRRKTGKTRHPGST
ncbi:MAG TPA: hypothetical protein PLG59_03600, partial [bacterium]|nr:hypothetical protein [bacterium]